jgi:phage terminase large subunit-like protein
MPLTMPVDGTPESMATFVEAVRLENLKRSGYQMRGYFPDDGPYRRELYPKHMAFLEAGKVHRERTLMGANQCLMPWTPIETGRATRQIGEMLGEAAFDVRSWDGRIRCTSQAGRVFLKGIEPAFRLELASGQWIDCTHRHRVLTIEGWLSVSQIIQRASGLRYWSTPPDYQASYATDGRHDGARPQHVSGSDPRALPSGADAQTRSRSPSSPGDGEVRRSRCIRTFQCDDHPSNVDDPDQISALCAPFQDPTDDIDAQWPSDVRQAAWRCATASRRWPTSHADAAHRPFVVDRVENGSRVSDRMLMLPHVTGQTIEQSTSTCIPALSWREFLEAAPYTVMFCPSSHIPLIGGQRIISVIPIGCQPVLDMTVESTHCYVSEGVISHNSGKTLLGAYEMTCHLTGLYPPWWKGRRFDRNVKAWAAGDTAKTVRGIIQLKLMGPYGSAGTGMIPKHVIEHVTHKTGVPQALEQIWVKHVNGKLSTLELKCHPAGTRIQMMDGSWAPIETIRLHDTVRVADGSARSVEQVHAYKNRPTVRVVTRSGEVVATSNHPFHTVNRDWVDCGDLKVGDVLSVATSYDDADSIPQEDWRVRMTALMIGDGCCRGKTPLFTCNEPPIVEMVKQSLPRDLYVVPIKDTISYKISSHLHKENRLKDSLESDGLWGRKSVTKFIPAWVFRLPRRQRVNFLRWLFGCDGTINSKIASYTSSSERLADDVRLLLWSLGIYSPVGKHFVTCPTAKGKKFPAWYVTMYGENRHKFSEIGKLNRSDKCKLKPRPKGPVGEIVKIEDAGLQDVFCVGVESVHELIANGYRVGNSYDQRREAFQGTVIDVIWLDEEPPEEIYTECLMRTMTCDGMVYMTFTPLYGVTRLVLSFLSAIDDQHDGIPRVHIEGTH